MGMGQNRLGGRIRDNVLDMLGLMKLVILNLHGRKKVMEV